MNFCPFVSTTLIFSEKNIAPCYIFLSEKVPLYLDKELEETENINFKQKKQEINDILNNEQTNSFSCQNCCNLTTKNLKNEKYDHFIFSLWNKTNFEYDIHKIIKQLYEDDMIDIENLKVEIQSKDFLTMDYLEQIIDLFEKYGYEEIIFMMNKVVYLPIIEKQLEKGKASLCIIYEYKNNGKLIEKEYGPQHILRSYISTAKNKNAISVHYQFKKDYNDNKKDIINFITIMYIIGINKISFNLENKDITKWLNEPLPLSSYPKKIKDLALLFFKTANKYSFYIDMNFREQTLVLKKIFKTYKKKEFKLKLIENIINLFNKKDNK